MVICKQTAQKRTSEHIRPKTVKWAVKGKAFYRDIGNFRITRAVSCDC